MDDRRFFDPDLIRRAVRTLKPNEELFEVRIIRGSSSISGYFRGAEKLVEQLSRQDLTDANVYMTIQRIHEGCEARRQWGHFIDAGRQKIPTTSDNDIIGYSFIPVDLDPVRPAGISSNTAELYAAEELTHQIAAYMTENGYGKYVKALSGNGYHLLFPVDIPTRSKAERDAARLEVETLLKNLDRYFSNDGCYVDTTLCNPSRVLKLYGTLAQKGRSTSDRPFRMSKILEVVDLEKD